MKSRTLSSENTLFKKDLVRFMPFWGLYILCLLLGLMLMSGNDRDSFYTVMNLGECARIMAMVNCGYGLLLAQLLFGDLFDSRMCSGIHSLPLRREQMFGIHVASGFLFSLVPTLIMALCALPLLLRASVEGAWLLSPLWLLAANLEFVFFFGLAVLCIFLTGSRFAAVVVYGLLNFWAVLAMLVGEALYLPMLRGVSVDNSWCFPLAPMLQIMERPLVIISREKSDLPGTMTVQPTWGYLWICAGIGILLLLLALVLYRHRKLETAGEFIAVKGLRPVFLVCFSLAAAGAFAVVSQAFFGDRSVPNGIVFSAVGLLVGWFIGRMLLEKTTHVFHKRSLLGAAILLVLVLLTFLLTWMDVFGVRRWTPDPEEVAWVQVRNYYSQFYGEERDRDLDPESQAPADALAEPGDIQLTVRLHELALEQNITREEEEAYYTSDEEPEPGARVPTTVSIAYTMKDGSRKIRQYPVWNDGESGQLARWLLSQPQAVFGDYTESFLRTEGPAREIRAENIRLPEKYLTAEHMRSLKRAILQDCEEGHMAQNFNLHNGELIFDHPNYTVVAVNLYLEAGGDLFSWLNIYSDSRHTMNWLEQRGIMDMLREDWENRAADY